MESLNFGLDLFSPGVPAGMDYERRQQELRDQSEKLKAEEARAKKLWAEHVEPLSPEDRELLKTLLWDHFHGED